MKPNLIKIIFSVARGCQRIRQIVADTGIPRSTAYYHLQRRPFVYDEGKMATLRLTEYGHELLRQYAVVRNKHDRIVWVGKVEKL